MLWVHFSRTINSSDCNRVSKRKHRASIRIWHNSNFCFHFSHFIHFSSVWSFECLCCAHFNFFSFSNHSFTSSVNPLVNDFSVINIIAFFTRSSSSILFPFIHINPFCPTVTLHPDSSFIRFIMLPSFPITLGTLFEFIFIINPSSILPKPRNFIVRSIPLPPIPIIFAATISPLFKPNHLCLQSQELLATAKKRPLENQYL